MSLYEPYRVWYLQDGEPQDEPETADGRRLDLTSKNPIRVLKEEATGHDLVEGELRWQGHVLPSALEETYGIPVDEAINHLEALESEGVCYSREWRGSYSPTTGW